MGPHRPSRIQELMWLPEEPSSYTETWLKAGALENLFPGGGAQSKSELPSIRRADGASS